MFNILNDPLAIPIYGIALLTFILWRIIASIPSSNPQYAERICRALNRFKSEPPTRIVSRFLARLRTSQVIYFMPNNITKNRVLVVWIKDEEYAFEEKPSGEWTIYYQD